MTVLPQKLNPRKKESTLTCECVMGWDVAILARVRASTAHVHITPVECLLRDFDLRQLVVFERL